MIKFNIVPRLKKQDKLYVIKCFEKIIPIFKTEKIKNKLLIVDENSVRIHEEDI
jgi:hypothetical protein